MQGQLEKTAPSIIRNAYSLESVVAGWCLVVGQHRPPDTNQRSTDAKPRAIRTTCPL